jgi:hypothetical protein
MSSRNLVDRRRKSSDTGVFSPYPNTARNCATAADPYHPTLESSNRYSRLGTTLSLASAAHAAVALREDNAGVRVSAATGR